MSAKPMVLPARFSGGGLTMQTTTSRLSPESVFIRCMVAPKEGARVAIELTLPGPILVQAHGLVAERIPGGGQGKESGFLATFVDLPPGAREQIERVLGVRPPQPAPARTAPVQTRAAPPEERRTFPRVQTHLQVGWSSPREFLVAYSENISRGGIFVSTPNPPALREVVELLLELPDGMAPARTQAEVVQRVTTAESKASGRVAGAGLQFVGADDEFRKRLDACMENLLGA